MEPTTLPAVAYGILAAIIGQAILLIWHASSAWSRLRSHGDRLDKLESKVEDHGEKIAKLMLEVSNRLERIETKLSAITDELSYRRNHP